MRARIAGPIAMDLTPLIAALATWRLTHLVHAEDGPWHVFAALRAGLARIGAGEAATCFFCASLWLALPVALVASRTWHAALLLWPALSAAAILLQRAAFPETLIETPAYTEENDDVLRQD